MVRLWLARSLEVRQLIIFSDSQLVIKQIIGEYEARGARMTKYLAEVKDQLHYFNSYSFQGVDRSNNTVVDALSKLAITDVNSFGGRCTWKFLIFQMFRGRRSW